MDKPISVIYEDTKKEVAEVFNKSGLPPFITQGILKDFLSEVSMLAKQQYEMDLKKYNEESGE